MSTLNGREIRKVVKKTANYTVKESENGQSFSNKGASGAVQFTLPPAKEGLWFRFYVSVAQTLAIFPDGNDLVALPSTGALQSTGQGISADAIGENVEIQCVEDGKWYVNRSVGTWTEWD